MIKIKLLLGSIIAVTILIGVSFTSVVGYIIVTSANEDKYTIALQPELVGEIIDEPGLRFGVSVMVTNIGIEPYRSNFSCYINISSLIPDLVIEGDANSNGVYDIPPGDSIYFRTGFVFGIGPVTVWADVVIREPPFNITIQKVKAFMIGPFIINLRKSTE